MTTTATTRARSLVSRIEQLYRAWRRLTVAAWVTQISFWILVTVLAVVLGRVGYRRITTRADDQTAVAADVPPVPPKSASA